MWNCSRIIPSGTSASLISSTLRSSPHKVTNVELHISGGPIRLRDDPEPAAGSVVVGREQPQALDHGNLVGAVIGFAEVAPVALCMASETGVHVIGVEDVQRSARGDRP